MGKQTKAQRIAELEMRLDEALQENATWDECHERTARDLRIARGELNRFREEERRQKSIADRKAREAEREAERKRLEDLAAGVVDLSKIKHDLGFDYDADTEGGTVTVTLHANAREAKILNSYATKDRTDSVTATADPMSAYLSAVNKFLRMGYRL